MIRKLYQRLDVSENATPEEIEKAYKRMASRWHPDKNLGNEAEAAEKFKEIKEAYECLSDPERRAVYDETGDATLETGNPSEDLFLHLLNEITDHMESSSEVLEKIEQVLSQMIDECGERRLQTDRKTFVVNGMLAAVRFQGKGANLLAEVLRRKLKNISEERDTLTAAISAAKGAYDLLKDYEATDRRSPESEFETPESLRIKTIESLMRERFGGRANQTGRRRGGMPFSGI